jgi:rhodanese-related sulfurtransferase
MSQSVPLINPNEVKETAILQNGQFLLVDVRREDEFYGDLGHIKDSRLITLGTELTEFLKAGDREQKIIFICRSGKRSETAALEALNLGYQQVLNMSGGMLAWNVLKLPVEKK